MKESIKAILFDSGGVLTYPVTGHWFIPPNFLQIINKRAYDRFHDIELNAAFAQAAEVLSNYKLIKSKEEEYSFFRNTIKCSSLSSQVESDGQSDRTGCP